MAGWYLAPVRQRLAGASQRSRRRAAATDRAAINAALARGSWRCDRVLRTVTDFSVCTVRGPGGRSGVLKVATTEGGMAALRREHAVLGRLGGEERLGSWRAMLPVTFTAGRAGPGAFLLTSRLPGTGGTDAPLSADRLTAAAVEAITPLHRLDRTVRLVDSALLARWVDEPVNRIRSVLPACGTLEELTVPLRNDLMGRTFALGWVHGDLYPGNLLVDAGGGVTGIVDWGGAFEQDLPVLDLAFWLLTVHDTYRPPEFGQRVATRLAGGRYWTPAENWVLRSGTDGALPADRTVLLLAWLRHVASNLTSTGCGQNLLWLRRNVVSVLRQVGRR